MKRLGKIVVCLGLIVCLVTGLAGCTTYTNFKNAFFADDPVAKERTIKIGIFEPISGRHRIEGNEEVMGIELAHELYPKVAGKTVELVYADNHSDMYVGETAIQEMITASSPAVILGSYSETLTLVAGKYIKISGIPSITISSTNPLITSNNEFYFSATYSETRQGDALADFAYKAMHKDSVATVKMDKDDRATATIKRFTNRIKKLTDRNQSVVGNFVLEKQNGDYSDIIEKIRDSGARTVFLAVSPAIAKEFLKQVLEKNLSHVLFLGPRSWNDEKLLDYVKETGQLSIAYPSEQGQDVKTEMSETFLETYKSKYGATAEPAERTAVAFDAYLLAIASIRDALAQVKKTEPDKIMSSAKTEAEGKIAKEEWQSAMDTGIPTGRQIKEALYKIRNFEGASGIINYDGKNEPSKTITINIIENGHDIPSYTVE